MSRQAGVQFGARVSQSQKGLAYPRRMKTHTEMGSMENIHPLICLLLGYEEKDFENLSPCFSALPLLAPKHRPFSLNLQAESKRVSEMYMMMRKIYLK